MIERRLVFNHSDPIVQRAIFLLLMRTAWLLCQHIGIAGLGWPWP